MIRSVASKVMWVGRATVFLVGLAVILALVVGVASSAFAANGQNFIIGNGLADTVKNIATLPTKLTMQGTRSGPALQVTQKSTNAGASGVGVTVPSGKAPLAVNSSAGKATNLNADKVDGSEGEMWAQIKPNGFAANWKGLVTNGRISSGYYRLEFERDVQECAISASLSSFADPGTINASTDDGDPKAVYVDTWDITGDGASVSDKEFHVVVFCGDHQSAP